MRTPVLSDVQLVDLSLVPSKEIGKAIRLVMTHEWIPPEELQFLREVLSLIDDGCCIAIERPELLEDTPLVEVLMGRVEMVSHAEILRRAGDVLANPELLAEMTKAEIRAVSHLFWLLDTFQGTEEDLEDALEDKAVVDIVFDWQPAAHPLKELPPREYWDEGYWDRSDAL